MLSRTEVDSSRRSAWAFTLHKQLINSIRTPLVSCDLLKN